MEKNKLFSSSLMKSNLQSSSRFNTVSEIKVDPSSDSENSQGHRHEDILEDKLEEDYEDIEEKKPST